MKKEHKDRLKKYFFRILFVLIICAAYLLGVNHGAMRISFAIGSEHCELMDGMIPIWPYGCEHENLTDNYCVDMNCQALSLGLTPAYDNNGAICLYLDDSEVKNQKRSSFLIGWVLTGCPLEVHSIGMNKYSGNRNWAVNKVEMSEWNGTVVSY